MCVSFWHARQVLLRTKDHSDASKTFGMPSVLSDCTLFEHILRARTNHDGAAILEADSTHLSSSVILGHIGIGLSFAVIGVLYPALLLLGGRWHDHAVPKRRPTVVLPLLLLTIVPPPVGSTSLKAALASNYDCYDPSGVSCTCSSFISLTYGSYTGTIPPELSACTSVTEL